MWITFLSSFQPSKLKVHNSSHFWEIRTVRAWRWFTTPFLYPKFDTTYFRSSLRDILEIVVCFRKYSWEECPQRAKLSDPKKKFHKKNSTPPSRSGVTFGRDEKWSCKLKSKKKCISKQYCFMKLSWNDIWVLSNKI